MRLPVLMFCVVCSLVQRQVRRSRQHQRKKHAGGRGIVSVGVRRRVRRTRWVLAAKDLAVAIRVRGQVLGVGGQVVAVVSAVVVGNPRVSTGVRRRLRVRRRLIAAEGVGVRSSVLTPAEGVGTLLQDHMELEKVSPIFFILFCSVYIPLSFYLSQTEASTYLLQEQSRCHPTLRLGILRGW